MADADVVHLVRFFFVSLFLSRSLSLSLFFLSMDGSTEKKEEEEEKKLREIFSIGFVLYITLIAAHGLLCMNARICAAARKV